MNFISLNSLRCSNFFMKVLSPTLNRRSLHKISCFSHGSKSLCYSSVSLKWKKQLKSDTVRMLSTGTGITDRISDGIRSFAENRVEATKEKQFKDMLNVMITAKKWTLRHWKTQLVLKISLEIIFNDIG